jgi:hypothetical protein
LPCAFLIWLIRSIRPAGIPRNVKVVLKYSTSEPFGAILLTNGVVFRDSVYHREPYKSWCKTNARQMILTWPDIRERGLWVVTETHSASQASINAWKDSKKEVLVGFSQGFIPVGESGPVSNWYTEPGDSGWIDNASRKVRPPDHY